MDVVLPMKTINYGASFTEDGLKCDKCGSVNDFKVIGVRDNVNGFGKVLKCGHCGSTVRQDYEYILEQEDTNT